MKQVGGHIFANGTPNEFHGAVKRLTFAVIAHHMQISSARSGFEIKSIVPFFIGDGVEL